MAPRDEDSGHPCSRIPPELCDGARITWQDDGSSKREPMLTPRTFCDPCRSRIITCLEELPPAYARLAAALGDVPRTGASVRAPFGPSEPVRAEVDALMRVTAVILHGWEFRVRRSRLQLASRDTPDILGPESVKAAAGTLATHIDVLLALQPGWMTRTFTFPPGSAAATAVTEGTCRRCGRRIARLVRTERRIGPVVRSGPGRWYLADPVTGPVAACAHEPRDTTASRAMSLIPPELETEIGDEEITAIGDGWVQVTRNVGAMAAGNEILDLHYRVRRSLGETRAQPESFDGIPCRACDEMALERAAPPSDPGAPVMHSKCALCKDEMDREEFAQWADMYASWARGAGIKACRRCALGNCHECCWAQCSCAAGEHPRRRAAA
jgi:hypothetical protein